MSFGDISTSRNTNVNRGQNGFGDLTSSSDKDPLAQLRVSLANFQKGCQTTKDKITELRRKKVSQTEKNQLDIQLKELRQLDTSIKAQFDARTKHIDNLPKSDAALQRAALSKLYKDYERLKVSLESINSEALLVKVHSGAPEGGFNRTGGAPNAISTAGANNDNDGLSPDHIPIMINQQKIIMKPVIHEQDADELIIAEREKEIKKINEDLILVNDMFKRMADIVDKQGEHIDTIHTATETSHERAQAGLEQVKQAADYQPVCTIS